MKLDDQSFLFRFRLFTVADILKELAESVGRWSGDCAPALSNGALHRIPGTMGISPADYDTTTPAIRAGDLLVVCTRSGKSPILHHAVDLARREKARVAAIVGSEDNEVARRADLVLRLPLEAAGGQSPQPMGSLFEQALLLYLDGVVLRLMDALGKTPEDMERIHSNLP